MEPSFWPPFIAALIAACVTTTGLFVIRKHSAWAEENMVYFSAFAAGVLISVSFLHIIPKAFSMNEHAPLFLLGGYFSFHLLNRFVNAYVCDKAGKTHFNIGLVPMFGIGLHSFIDGMIYSIAFTVSILTGVLSVVGMILHEFPEGIITYVLLRKSGFSDIKSFVLAFLAAAVTTPLGMLVSYPLVSVIDQPTLGVLLSFSAGSLLYVGATHLLPKVETEPKKLSLIALAVGIGCAMVIIWSK